MSINENILESQKCQAIRIQIIKIVRNQQIKTETDKTTKKNIQDLIERIVDGK